MADLHPQDHGPPDEPSGASSGALDHAWSKIKQQRSEFERRSEVLDALRQRLSKHLDKQNRVLLDRQRALDIRRVQNERERAYLNDARLHLRRCRQEEHEALRRMQHKAQELEGQAEQIRRERTELDQRLSLIREQYTTQIDGLMLEKHSVEQRVEVLELEVIQAQQREEASGVRLYADWRLGLAVLAGVLAIGTLFMAGHFDYRLHGGLQANPGQLSAGHLETHRVELGRALADLETTARPDVQVLPEAGRIQVTLRAVEPAALRDQLLDQLRAYLDGLERQRAARRTEVQSELSRLTSELASAQQEFERLVTTLADQRLSVQVENPRAELQRLRTGLAEKRQQFEVVRADLEASEIRLASLQPSDVPEVPQLDPELLQAAEAQDTQLHLDTEQLRFQLGDLRRHVLDAFKLFPEHIERFHAAAQGLAFQLEARRLDLHDSARAALEAIRLECENLARAVLNFQQQWSLQDDRLSRLPVDPRSPQIQELHQAVDRLVEEFNLATNEILKTLQLRQQEFARTLDSQAEHFQLTSEIRSGLQGIQEAQFALLTVAGHIRTRSDLKLQTIVHRVDGLSRRTRERRSAIAALLAEERRQTLHAELTEAAQGESARHEQLSASRQHILDEMLLIQDQLNDLIPYIEEHGVTSTVVRYTKAQADELSIRMNELQERERTAGAELAALMSHEQPLAILPARMESWPANALPRLATIGCGGLAAAVFSYLLLLLVPVRRQVGPAAVSTVFRSAHVDGNERG